MPIKLIKKKKKKKKNKFVTCEMLFEVYLTRDRDETRSNHGYYFLCRATMRKAFAVNTMVETGDKVST